MADDLERPPDQAAAPQAAAGRDIDRAVSILSIAGFALSLGSSGLVLPLLAVAVGYDLATVGILTAISAVSQLGFRLLLPWLLTRYSDRSMIVVSNVMLVASFSLLLFTTALPVFIVSQLLQGAARALFWTASQTHAVRAKGHMVQSLSMVQAVGNLGQDRVETILDLPGGAALYRRRLAVLLLSLLPALVNGLRCRKRAIGNPALLRGYQPEGYATRLRDLFRTARSGGADVVADQGRVGRRVARGVRVAAGPGLCGCAVSLV